SGGIFIGKELTTRVAVARDLLYKPVRLGTSAGSKAGADHWAELSVGASRGDFKTHRFAVSVIRRFDLVDNRVELGPTIHTRLIRFQVAPSATDNDAVYVGVIESIGVYGTH